MRLELTKTESHKLAAAGLALPALVRRTGPPAAKRFVEFFTANIRNANTRRAYGRAVNDFMSWCEQHGVAALGSVQPVQVAAYIEQLQKQTAPQTVKQHLAAIRMLFDWLVIGQIVPVNPASSVRGPRYVIKKGKTPVLSGEDARKLLDSIDTSQVVGLRDRALMGLMVYSFARVGAVLKMRVEDYYPNGKRWWIRLHEKGGKFHEVPVHHQAEAYLDAYLKAAGIEGDKKSSLFRAAIRRTKTLTKEGIAYNGVWKMVKRRAKAAGLSPKVCCHTFRATGITNYLENGGSIENAQAIAAHESPRTTKLYDRRSDRISLEEVERIRL